MDVVCTFLVSYLSQINNMPILLINETYDWMAPYAFAILVLGVLFFLFRIFEIGYASKFDRPLYRDLFIYKKLTEDQLSILKKEFDFYRQLSEKEQRQFQHRVAVFLAEKNYLGRDGLVLTEQMKVLIAATGCMLSFGRKNFSYDLVEHILVYPKEFYSSRNDDMHVGEFNPQGKALVFSWPHFEKGYQITNDNRNLGIHEFMHAMHMEAVQGRDLDSSRLAKHFRNILQRLTQQEVKDKLDQTRYFRAYAFTNQFEFLAVLTEYFVESPTEFKSHFPDLYTYTQKLLNYRFAGY